MVYKRKKYHYGDTHLKRKWRTKRRSRDLDQIDDDLKPENVESLVQQEVDLDKPGNAQFYCVHCARYFINNQSLQEHFRTKVHKRRLKALELEPYTIEDSERAAGFGNFKTPVKRKIETQKQEPEIDLTDSSSDKANTNFAVLTPYLDFEERMKDKPGLMQNIKLRKKDINLEKIVKQWNFYKSLEDQRIILETTKFAMSNEISRLMKEPEQNQADIEKLKLYLKHTKSDHKSLRDYLYGIEESAAINALSLPNILDTRTPCENEVEMYTFLDKPPEQSKFHLDIAASANLIEFTDPTNVYLKKDAALSEFFIFSYLHDVLQNHLYTPFVNTSFGRSVIAEGCCTNYFNKSEIFTIKEDTHNISRLHFFGGATLYSFMAYFARFSIQTGYFPLKLYTCGRQYNPVISNDNSLFNLEQYSAVEIFIATRDDDAELDKEFDAVVNVAKEIYESLGYHFQFVYLPAHKLKNFESLRLSLQMYSCFAQKYIEVGHISLCECYLSKRLLVTYTENKQRKYSRLISGTLLNLQKLLGCILEYNDVTNNSALLTDVLKRYAPV